jgi:hypothetical protein
MKTIRIVFISLIMILFSFSAYALNLEVDNDLNTFANQNLLNGSESEKLNNPFFIKKEVVETLQPEEEEVLEKETPEEQTQPAVIPAETREERVEKTESEPEIIINGVISAANSKIALLVSYRQEKHLLKIGSSVADYKLTAYRDGEATFVKNGREIKISY